MNVWIKRRDEDCRFLPRNPGDTIEPWTTGNTVIFLDMLRLMSHGSHREIQTNRQKNGCGWNQPGPVGHGEIWAPSHEDRAETMELMGVCAE